MDQGRGRAQKKILRILKVQKRSHFSYEKYLFISVSVAFINIVSECLRTLVAQETLLFKQSP